MALKNSISQHTLLRKVERISQDFNNSKATVALFLDI
jgi:hypothetical protein